MDTMMEDILLPLDKGDSGRAIYNKVVDGDDCVDGREQVHVPLANNSDCHRTLDVHKTDARVFLNKESTPSLSTHPTESSSAVKPKLSSAFMISSILSTKSSSSFSSNVYQVNNSPHFKMTNNASDYVAGADARIDTSIAKVSEMKPNASVVHSNNSAVDYRLGSSKRYSPLERTSQQLADDLPEFAKEHTLMDVSTDTVEAHGHEGYDSAIKATHDNDDVEDMQVEITTPLSTKNDFTGSETNVDDPLTKSVASAKEGKTKKTVDGKTVSTLRSDFHNKADNCNEMLSESDESNKCQDQIMNYQDKLVVDENTDINAAGSELVFDNVVTDACTIKISKNATETEDNTTDLVSDASLDDFDTENKKKESRESSSHVNLNSTTNKNDESSKDFKLSSSNSEKHKYLNNPESSSVDSCEFENLDNQNLPRSERRSCDTKSSADNWQNNQSINMKGTNLTSEDNKSLFDPKCKSKAVDSSEETEIPVVENNLSTHSQNVQDDCETNGSKSPQEINVHHKKVKFLDINVDVKKECEVQDENTSFRDKTVNKEVVETLPQVKQKILDDVKDKSENKIVNEEIHVVDETCKSEPVNSSVHKYTFKNILFMPKDKTLNCNKNTSNAENSECLKSSETVTPNKPLPTASKVDEKLEDKPELKMTLNTKMDSVECLQNNESANERKRFQKGGVFSAPKRSRLDSMDDNDVKKAKDTASGVFDDAVTLAETPVTSAEDKAITKLKDDKTVSLSSEALQGLITLRVKVFIKNKKQAHLDRLNLRTRGMQSASNLWKETAKHLERSVLELTALNQKLESRKAHLLAVKRLSSRSIGTQVNEENVNTSGSVANVTPSPSGNPAQRSQPLGTQSPVQRTGRPGRPPLYRQPVSNIPSTSLQPSATTQPEKIVPPPVGKSLDTQTPENTVNLIDLTDDEDISRNVVSKTSTPLPQPVNHAVNKSTIGGKIAASTPGNGIVQPSRQIQGTPGTLVSPSNKTGQPATIGSHHITGNSTVLAASSQQQVVTGNNSSAQQSGTVTGSRPGAAANTYVSPGQPNTPTNTRVLPQNTAPPVSTPAVNSSAKTAPLSLPPSFLISNKHPAPLPFSMDTGNAPPTAKKRPPKPSLKISRVSQGIVLSWNMPSLSDVEKIQSYQLYAYQESDSVTPRSSLWKKVGEVSALPLPMACTLTQFQEGNKYHFAVRAVDQYGRCGSYSDPSSIYLGPKT